MDISGEFFLGILTTSPDLVDAIIELLDEVDLDLSASKNSNTPELEEDDDFTAEEKAYMDENIWAPEIRLLELPKLLSRVEFNTRQL